MKKIFKKVLAIFMTAVISLTALGITAGAAGILLSGNEVPYYTGSSSTSNSVTLEWITSQSIFHEDFYHYGDRVLMLNSKTGKYKKYKDLKNSGDPYKKCTIKDLKANTTYSFKIATLYMDHGSLKAVAYTDAIKVKTKSSTSDSSAKLSAPTNLSIVTKGANSVSMKWDAVKGAEKYQVYCKTDLDSKYKIYGSTKQTTVTVKGLNETTQYTFKVRAVASTNGKTVKSKFSSAKTVKARVASVDPKDIEKRILAYIKQGGSGSIDTTGFDKITEIKIFGDKYVGVTCGNKKGTQYDNDSFKFEMFTMDYYSPGGHFTVGAPLDLKLLSKMENLESAVIRYVGVTDYEPLTSLKKLKKLDIEAVTTITKADYDYIRDPSTFSNPSLKPIAKLTQLESFSASRAGADFTETVARLKNLKSLHSVDQSIDFSVLEDHTKLEHIDLDIGNAKNVSSLGKLTNLKYLVLENRTSYDPAPDFDKSFLKNLKKLEYTNLKN